MRLLAGEKRPEDAFCALACLQYTEHDDPDRWARAHRLLQEHPDLAYRSAYVAAAAGDPAALQEHLDRDPAVARRDGGPLGFVPLLYLVYSRVPQADPLACARALLAAGADPNAGFLWRGLVPPFTALTGCFGEGEQGPGRQPRHPQGEAIARLLLDAGADPNDGQTLYNRMFGRDDSHLRLLLEYGLGSGDGGAWARRLGRRLQTPAEMLAGQVQWARERGFRHRLDLLARHGVDLGIDPALAHGDTHPTADGVHRAGSPGAVRELVAAGADVNLLVDGQTALHHQAWIGDVEMVQALLDAGADPDVIDSRYGTTPLGWAEYGRAAATADLLRPLTGRR